VTIDWAVWGPPAAVLCAGLAVAILTVVRLRSEDRGVAVEGRTIDLTSTRDAMLETLRQLEIERPKMTPAEYEHERSLLLARGARALEALDQPATTPEVPAPTAATAPGAVRSGLSPEWRGALAMLVVVLVVVGLWSLLNREATPRREGANMTGNQDLAGAEDPKQSPEFVARKQELEAQLAADPNNVETLNQLTFLFLRVGDPAGGGPYNERALTANPKDLDARGWHGVLAAFSGREDEAMADFDTVLAESPNHPLATVYKGMLLLQRGQAAEAIPYLERAVAASPGNPGAMRALEQARNMVGMTPPATGGAPGGTPAIDAQVIVQGTIAIDPSSPAIPPNAMLFWSVREPGRPGPPVAADRAAPGFQLPMTFSLTTAQIRAMPGAATTLPAVVDLTVRVDGDGNAMTREPGLPAAVVTGLPVGSTGVQVLLTASQEN
jgi:Tfp pilus assembly protein PilF